MFNGFFELAALPTRKASFSVAIETLSLMSFLGGKMTFFSAFQGTRLFDSGKRIPTRAQAFIGEISVVL